MKRALNHWLVFALLVSSVGCGVGSFTPDPLFDDPDLRVAEEHAPELFAEARAAHEQARAANGRGDTDAANDHQTRARLLLAAAQVEAERRAVERARLEDVAREQALLAELRAQDDSVIAEQEAADRERAVEIAEQEALAAFERASTDEPRRHRTERRERRNNRKHAARVINRRARLTVAAARAMGADEPLLTEAEEAIEATRVVLRGVNGVDAIAQAQRAFSLAQAALGNARAKHERPTQAQARSLAESAREQGMATSHLPRGAAMSFPGRLREADVRRLVDLARAFPHGTIQIDTTERNIPIARRQVRDLLAALRELNADRVIVEAAGGRPRIEVVFTAYVLTPTE